MLENDIFVSTSRASENRASSVSGIVGGLFRQRVKLLLVISFVFGVTLFWTYGTPKQFTSEMVLLVQNARGNEVVTSNQSINTAAVNDVSEEQMNSEVAVLDSNDILDEVVDPGWSQRPLYSRSRAELLAHERAVRKMRTRLDVSPIRTSHAITIKIVSTSPELARETLTRLLKAFLLKQKDLGRLPGASSVFAQQVKQYETQLAAARRELAEYQNKHGFVSVGAQESALEVKLSDLQAAARDADVQISELEQRISADRQQLAATPERLSTIDKSSTATGAIDQLNVLLVTLQNRRAELLMKYKSTDRLVSEVDQQIENTKAGIKQATIEGPHELSTDLNPLWQATRRDLNTNLVAITGMRARRDRLGSQVASLQSDLSGAESQAGDYDALQQRVAELESSYQGFIQKRDNSLVSDLMDQQQWLNVAVVQYPTLSLTPSHPQPKRDIPFGLLTALLLGGCAVFLFETMRQEVSTPADLELASRYPVLATMPYAPLVGWEEADSLEPADLAIALPEESGTRNFDSDLGLTPAMRRGGQS